MSELNDLKHPYKEHPRNICQDDNGIHGYKVFKPDWTSIHSDMQYEVGKTYVLDDTVKIEICTSGFHFCTKLEDCFDYYAFDDKHKIAEVIGYGEHCNELEADSKHCARTIYIAREVSFAEALHNMNNGKANFGRYNNGIRNDGNNNAGDSNYGDSNQGDRNIGSYNFGDNNYGNYNTGGSNAGSYNTGNHNHGNHNMGFANYGHYSSGVFCTKSNKLTIFDVESDMDLDGWLNSGASALLGCLEFNEWVNVEDMTEAEKIDNPSCAHTGGFMRNYVRLEAWRKWWDRLMPYEKYLFLKLPNFDAEKFKYITGIDIISDTELCEYARDYKTKEKNDESL
jgi:hypothetical protein